MKTGFPNLTASVTWLILFAAGGAMAQDSTDGEVVARWKAHVLNLENVTKHTDGEDICWLATPYLRGMVAMAEALDGDRECLDAFCKAFEHLISIASRDVDGLYGWPTRQGTYGQYGPRCIIMDDAMIAEPVAHFAQVVRRDAELKEAYGERAGRYLKFVEEEVFPKWKESWLEFQDRTTTLRMADGGGMQREEVAFPEPAGVYRYYLPGKTLGTSLPLNQFLIVARAYLALHDATGRADYLEKARRLAATARYVYLEHNAARTSDQAERFDPWCYWQPVWEGDFKGETEAARWVGPHPERASYHAGEVSIIAGLHQRGIVFTDEDVRRIARLHLEVMWNKDPDAPRFSYYYERRKMTYPAMLWTSLACFDSTIARMTAPSETRGAIASVAGKWNGIGGVPEYFLRRKRPKGGAQTDSVKEEAMTGKEGPPRKVVIGAAMYAMYGGQRKYPGLEKRLEELGEIVDEMAGKAAEMYPGAGLDLAVLPEFAVNGGLPGTAAEVSFDLEGPVLEEMGARARQHRAYLVVPMFLADDRGQGSYSNACALLDRKGGVVGVYRKVHPVAAKASATLEGGVTPGREFPVFDCDFGRLGIQICFDIEFEDGWEALARKGAEVVAWPTQSPQTVRPASHAMRRRYYIVSSTWRNNASLFEPTGMIAAQIREPERVLVRQIDLSYAILPWQPELRNGKAMTERYGDRVGYHYSEAEDCGLFWSSDPGKPIGQMVREMGLEEKHESLERNRRLQDAVRGGPPNVSR